MEMDPQHRATKVIDIHEPTRNPRQEPVMIYAIFEIVLSPPSGFSPFDVYVLPRPRVYPFPRDFARSSSHLSSSTVSTAFL